MDDQEEQSSYMPTHTHAGHGAAGAESPFPALMAEVMATADRFAHRQHVHLTYLAVRRYGIATAIRLVSDGIQATARYAGAPQKYNATVSRAWVELVGHHAEHHAHHRAEHGGTAGADFDSFDGFARQNPELLDKRLLTHFYRPATLAGSAARTGWVAPDLKPFPWATDA